jgi:putative chitinase
MTDFNEKSALLLKRSIDSGITTPAELANIMGNASVETKSFTTMDEDLGYRSVGAVLGASSSADERFTVQQIQDAVDSRDPKQIATILYENRGKGDLGNTEPGDGWKYHGRGFFQYTGRYNYQIFGEKFGVDLVSNPEQAAEPEMAAKLAISYWNDVVPKGARLDARLAGEAINGGHNGASDRIAASQQWSKTITPELVSDIQSGRITLEQLSTMGATENGARGHAVGGSTLKLGAHGDAVTALQTDLAALGYTDNRGQTLQPDGHLGRNTEAAVKAFQSDYGLPVDGMAGKNTLDAIQSQRHSLSPIPALAPELEGNPHPRIDSYAPANRAPAERDPRAPGLPDAAAPAINPYADPHHPDHGLYAELRQRIPNASENRIVECTAACHMAGIRSGEVGHIQMRGNEALMFAPNGGLGSRAEVALTSPAPSVQQTMQHVQTFEQNQQVAIAQMNAQQQQTGPVLGGPTMG